MEKQHDLTKALNILSLEDSPEDFKIIFELLLSAGVDFTMNRVENEHDFVSALNTAKYDVIVADFNLPQYDAFEALKKAIEICPEIPFICVSGSIGEETAIELIRKGAVDYVLKDKPQKLPYAIKRALNEAKEKKERKQIEDELRKSETLKGKMVANIGDVIVIIDLEGINRYKSPNVEKLFGWKPEDLVGFSAWDNVHPDDLDDAQHFIASLASKPGKVGTTELRYRHKDGHYSWIQFTCSNLKNDPDIQGLLGNYHDITVRKESEIELKSAKEKVEDSEVKYRALFINAPLSYQSLDENGCIIDINPMWVKTLGYERNEVLGNWYGDYLHPDYVQYFKINFPAFKKRGYVSDVQFKMKRKDGTYIMVSFEGCVGYTPEGKFKQTYCVFKDITEQKALEIALIKAKEKAEESDRLKSAFLANMSHEIRTPMNGILGFAELLKEPGLSGEELQEYISIIEKSGVRMLNIINDIVSISKIEAGLMTENIQESNINEQIEYIYTFFKPEVEGKGMHFSFTNALPLEEAILKTDREKVYAILTNLIKNAIKYSEKGAIEFGYSVETRHALSLQKDHALSLQFYVKDTGIGIPKNRQEAIFERFIQADISDKMARQGAGLGLSISKAYIEMLGGKIWVESEEGLGSTFYFTLPYQSIKMEEKNAKNEILTPVEVPPVKKLKTLIAEDDESSKILISIIVQKFGNEIISVKTGTEAVAVCLNNPDIDVVLMDILMPEMDGYEATRQIRKFNKDLIIIAQTAYALEGDKEKAIAAGCNGYIAKPIKADELKQMLIECQKKNN